MVSGKPNSTFDGLAFVAAATSMVGLALHGTTEYKRALDCVFTGRAIDMIRCLRLNEEARGIGELASNFLLARGFLYCHSPPELSFHSQLI